MPSTITESTLLGLFHQQLLMLRLDTTAIRNAATRAHQDPHSSDSEYGYKILPLLGQAVTLFVYASPQEKRPIVQFLCARAEWNGKDLHVRWKSPFDLLVVNDEQPAPPNWDQFARLLGQAVMPDREVAEKTLAALERIASIMERFAPPPKWLTKPQAAEHLKISIQTLTRVVAVGGHLDGGPVDVGEGRKLLRFYTDTLDAWYQEAGRLQLAAPPQPKRRKTRKPRTRATAGQTPVDWSKV